MWQGGGRRGRFLFLSLALLFIESLVSLKPTCGCEVGNEGWLV